MIFSFIKKFPGLFLLLLLSGNLFAANPWYSDVNKTGKPARWPFDGTNYTIYWFSDPGKLSSKYDNAFGVNLVKELFQKWKEASIKLKDGTSIKTVALNFVYCGNLNAPISPAPAGCKIDAQYKSISDIDASNYKKFSSPDMIHPPPTVIIFDEDGSIIYDYFHQSMEKKLGVVGMGNNFPDSATTTIKSGLVVLNGSMVNGVHTSEDNELPSLDAFKGPILHEIGHLLNLDHALVNEDIAAGCTVGGDCPSSEGVSTMYPAVITEAQGSLHNDDVAAVSFLYPSKAFVDNFCRVEGDVQDPNGKGIQGVNVTAKNVSANPIVDARGWVSGALYPLYAQNGHYILPGLLPNQNYEIDFSPINRVKFNGASAVGPDLEDKGPPDFKPGVIPGAGDSQTIHCDKGGGDPILMPVLKLNLAAATTDTGTTPPATNSEQTPSSGKGFCSLNKNQSFSWGTFLGFLAILCIPLSFSRRPQ